LALAARGAWALDVEAVTRPHDDRVLAFTRPGLIGEIFVKEGDAVKEGQALVQLDNAAEKIEVEQLKALADDDTRVLAAQAQLEQKKEDLLKLQQAEVKRWDIVHAELDVTIAELSLKLSRVEREQSARKYHAAAVHLDRMCLRSPIDGTVLLISRQAGESVDALQDVVRIVNVNPLRMDVPCPTSAAKALRLGEAAAVRFLDGTTADGGKITFIADVADSASDTLTVRVELPNEAKRLAGEHVVVSFETEKPAEPSAPAARSIP